jgi:alkylhydroperoxidase family enzyme
VTVALLVGASLAALCVIFVAWPFLREPGARNDRLGGLDDLAGQQLELAEERDRTLAALKELEFDHRTGKVSDDDYRALRAPLRRRAAEALRALELRTAPATGKTAPAATARDQPVVDAQPPGGETPTARSGAR